MAAASKPNAAYWQKRFKAIENQANLTGADSLSYITAQYVQAAKQIEAQISTWYVRFAKNNGISMHEAKQALAGSALAEFQWTVQDYIKYGEENALNGLWMQQLENASAKWHITKLEALQLQNQATIEALFGKQYQSLSGALGSIYQGSYYHSCYEVQKAFEIGWNVAAVDDSKLSAILSTPWTLDGSTFSDRLWVNKQKLIQETQNTLTQGVMTGKAPDKMIAEIQAKMKTSRANAGRLVMTESAAMSAMGQKDAFGELGVEEFQIVETLDDVTCDICAEMDGQHFPMSDYEIGVTVPPFHPWCRGCTCPYFKDEFTADSERIARTADGTQYYVPGDTTYQEWKTAFVDGDKSGFDAAVNEKSGLTAYKPLQAEAVSGIITEYRRFETGDAVNGFFYYDGDKLGIKARQSSQYGIWKNNLSVDEEQAIRDYTANGYRDINKCWRRGSGWETIPADKVEDASRQIDAAISRFHLKESITVQRGLDDFYGSCLVESREWNDIHEIVGMTYRDFGYGSSTALIGNRVATAKPYLLEIDIPAGVGRGAYVNKLAGQYEDQEYEFLIARGSKFEITGVEINEEPIPPQTIIKMRMIVDE